MNSIIMIIVIFLGNLMNTKNWNKFIINLFWIKINGKKFISISEETILFRN